ncbi:MAG TPA: HIT domain-containing protein [Syntrophales bacterium]|nr:HIT domain-containing protein [Syntrophales bacterium]
MKAIYAPWRMTYLKSDKPDGCVFCKDSLRQEDLILLEGKTAYIMLNLYPYINGHLMIIPYRHVCKLDDLAPEEKLEMFQLIDVSVKSLEDCMHPEGFNVGINLGKAAGAGVDDHVHIHVVPRWIGDTNFMTIVGEVRVIPDDLIKTWEKLVPVFRKNYQED